MDSNVFICCCKFSSKSSNNPLKDANTVKCISPKYCLADLAAFPEKDLMLFTCFLVSSFILFIFFALTCSYTCRRCIDTARDGGPFRSIYIIPHASTLPKLSLHSQQACVNRFSHSHPKTPY